MSEESSSIPFEKREGENPERFIPDGMNAFERNVKRIGDCLLAFIALIVFSPLFLICYIVVRCEDGGPAVFKQERIGRFGRPFHIYKFPACVWTLRNSVPPFTREARIPV